MQPNSSHSEKNPDVAIVGAGLVGSLLSLYLARRGYQVDLFERRPDMRVETVDAGRSINLAVSARGLCALRELGLEEKVLEQAVAMKGRMIHGLDGSLTFQRYGKDDSECIHSISRAGLNQMLMSAAEETGKVSIHFRSRAVACDLGKRSLDIEEPSGIRSISPRLLFGTDGSASVIRQEIAKQPGAECMESVLDYGYKELAILPGPQGAFKMEKNALHIWPRGNFMLIGLPNYDGSYTVTLFLPMESSGPCFAALRTPRDVQAFFQQQFPDAVPLLDQLTDTFFSNPTGRMVTVRSAPWNSGDWALLVGDAAHAIVPFFGQGMNCGFEDCTILDQLMARFGKDWNRKFSDYSRERKPDSDAIADLAIENFTEMRDKVGNKRFLLQKEAERILENEFPQEYLSRYRLVSFHRVPYRVALKAGKIQDEMLNELCEGLSSGKEVDITRAASMIRSRLVPLWKQEMEKTSSWN